MILKNKKVLIGVTGSIAAYKMATLVRILKKQDVEIKIIMTSSALDFISPLTLATLSGHEVYSDFFDKNSGKWFSHVDLGLWCDIFLIAPASANTLAKCANGLADNLLVATYLSCRNKVFFAPAMDLDMWNHPSTLHNIEKLRSFGNQIIDPNDGPLASGLEGKGRMAEPEEIFESIKSFFLRDTYLIGKNVLITAGPTQEDIDPVRFISNHSSGKMGYEIAKIFNYSGANVTLVSGPTSLPMPSGVKTLNVRTGQEMFETMKLHHRLADIVIFCAAVADYRPAETSKIKIKKNENDLQISLIKNPDIAYELGLEKSENQIHVGFALETNDELENAKGKLKKKNFDLIVLNSLQDKGSGFRYDTNKITVVNTMGQMSQYQLKTKEEVAIDIRNEVVGFIKKVDLC
jgi:phosphopantothenoylcysteine decarboxylase/phosphopantothenate--cysteine ligase